MRGQNLKALVESEGSVAVAHKLAKLLTEEKPKIRYEDFSFKELWEAFVGPCGQTLEMASRMNQVNFVGLAEAPLNTTAFKNVTGQLIASKVLEGYNAPGYIGDMLTTNFPSNRRTERIVGFTSVEGLKEVHEGEDYEDSGMGEKFVTTATKKKGRLIDLTEEIIMFDQAGQVALRAQGIGEKAKLDKEKTIILGITQPSATYYAYRPSGVAAALYTQAWELITTNPLTDWRDIEESELAQAEAVDETGDPIVVMAPILLVPTAIKRTAQRIVAATEVSMGADTTIWTRGANPMRGDYTVVSSPLVHKLQVAEGIGAPAASADWWMGDFKKQFMWQEIWPIQVLTRRGQDTEHGWNRDVVTSYKVRHFGGLFATDNKFVAKNDAA